MADNVTYQATTLATPPDATVVSTDETGVGHVQRVKLAMSADGSATHIPADVDGLLVNLGANNDVVVSDGGGSVTVDNTTLAVVGGGVEAAALRVTLATDSTGVVSVDDNGTTLSVDDGASSLTVDAPVGTPVNVQVGDGTRTATVRDTGTSDSLNVAIVDAAGNQVTSFGGGGTQYTEDGASAGGESLTLAGAVRRDTAASSSGSDGDYSTINTDGSGRLWVNASGAAVPVTDNGGSLTVDGTVAATQSGTWTLGANSGVDIGDVTVNNAAGASAVNVQDGGNSLTVDNAGTFAVQDSEKVADNAAFTDGTTRVQPAGFVFDETAGTALTENDAAAARVDAKRAQVLVLEDATTRGQRATVSAAGAVKTDGSAVTQPVSGTVTVGTLPGTATEDAASAGGETGHFVLGVRNDAAASLTSANGDFGAFALDSAGRVGIADLGGAISIDDNGSTISIDDGAGSITVDGTVAVSGTVDTELPAAAALADNTANPTVPAVAGFGMVWDGATWDRQAGTSADGTLVNLGANNDVTVTGTVTANLAAGTNNIGDVDVLTVPAPLSTTGGGTEATALRVTVANDSTGVLSVDDNGGSLTVDGTVAVSSLPASTNTLEVVGDVAQDAAVAGNPVLIGLRASDAVPTAMSADGDAVYGWADRKGRVVTVARSATPTQSSVAGSATSVTVLAANTARAGATIFNDSTATLYLKLGATASTSSFTTKMYQDGYYEVPFGYTGVIDGIWSSATGNARITEIV